jgi:hypothetical protein
VEALASPNVRREEWGHKRRIWCARSLEDGGWLH